jgi:phycoerythrin-associated linker protein
MPAATIAIADAGLRQESAQATIRAAYRQVFGNAHLMEEDRSATAESLYINGDLNVQGLVTALALSDSYRRLFLDKNGPYRFVELNFKHLLGRAPRNQAEVSEHVQRLAKEGYEAEINSYTFSVEYINAFGLDDVPHMRGNQILIGESNATYVRSKALDNGFAGFDGSHRSVLLSSIGSGAALSAGSKVPGPGNRDSKRYSITWTTANPVGMHRRSMQTSIAPYSSLTTTIQGIQKRGGRILSVANT